MKKSAWIGLGLLAALAAYGEVPPERLGERLARLDVRAAKLFHPPQNEFDKSCLQVGVARHWARYGQENKIDPSAFKGYVLFADPYQLKQRRISFLLGADCSNFVQRLFQVLGAEFAYAKTRHFIHAAKSLRLALSPAEYLRHEQKAASPVDSSEALLCHLRERFELVTATAAGYRAGDLLLFVDGQGLAGEKGHVALVLKAGNDPTILHAHSPNLGILEQPLSVVKKDEGEVAYVLRWRADRPLRDLAANTLEALLQQQYPLDVKESCEQGLNNREAND